MSRVLCVGHAVQDFVFGVEALPTRGEKYRARSFTTVGGGPAATAAVAIARLGGEALLAARIGDDLAAGLIAAELEGYGVDCRWLRRFAGCGSSVSAVMVDPAGERMIGWQVEAQQCFLDILRSNDTTRATASSGPYRRPEVYTRITTQRGTILPD